MRQPFSFVPLATATLLHFYAAINQAQAADTPIVLRISKRLVDELTADEIVIQVPIRDDIEGIPVSGTSVARGRVEVRFETSKGDAVIYLKAVGRGHGNFHGTAGPVTATGEASIPFTLKTRVSFDGYQFNTHSVTSTATIHSKIGKLCTARDGPIARVVRKVAREKLSKAKPTLDSYLLAKATSNLKLAMEQVAEEVVQELNDANQLDEMIVNHFPNAKSWRYHVAATEQIITVAVGPERATIPNLPTSSQGDLRTSMDIWIKTTWGEELVLKAALTWNSTQNLLRRVLPADVAKSIADDVKLATIKGWFVISVGRKAVFKALEDGETG